MKTEQVGEIFIDGKIVNLDNASIETLNGALEQVKLQKQKAVENINTILDKIQN